MLKVHVGARFHHVEPALQSAFRGTWLENDRTRSKTEELLLTRIARADTQAFEALYEVYGRAVYSLALTMLRDPQAAQEVAQDVFLGIWHGAHGFDPQRGSARGWILSLAHHKSVDTVRRQRLRAKWALDGVEPNEPDIVNEALQRVEGERVQRTLMTLSPEQRQAIVLAYYGGYTQREIAERLGIALGTVKTRIRDGLLRLRSLLTSTATEADQ